MADDNHNSNHVVPVRTYIFVFLGLLILLALTITASYINLGPPWETIATLTIAVAKASLILAYFMHLRYSSRLIWIFGGLGFFWWFVIMFLITMGDYWARNSIEAPLIGAPLG